MCFETQSTLKTLFSNMKSNEQTLPPPEKLKTQKQPEKDNNSVIGYAMLLASILVFVLTEYSDPDRRNHFSIVVAHYIVALAYVINLISNNAYGIRKCWRKENINRTIILLNLFLISAYALNRSFTIFEEATNWLYSYLLITSLNALSYQYFHSFPIWVNRLQAFIAGVH